MGPVSEFTTAPIKQNQHGELAVNRYTSLSRSHERLADDGVTGLHRWNQSGYISSRSAELSFDAPVGGIAKRSFDLLIAITTLILMAPTMIIVALLIYCTSGGPVFFVQQRVGFNRRLFGCLKFRTMVVDADKRLSAYLAQNLDAARDWRETQKLKNDPRVTWLGHILRKSSLDELPQLFNVIRGEMSCIGPRPVLLDELKRYGAYDQDYSRAKPGLTGLWQVNGRSNTSYEHRVNCDRYYVRRWSLGLDIGILLRTIPAVLKVDQTG